MNQIVWKKQIFLVSRFLRLFKRNGVVTLFHQLHPQPVYLSEKTWQSIFKKRGYKTLPNQLNSLIEELIDCKLFVSDEKVDQRELASVRNQAIQLLNRPTILYLMMAQSCNLACTYCPIPVLTKKYGEKFLTFEDAVAGIKLWQKHIEEQDDDNEPYFLIFYGGEPLLNQKVLERLLPYLEEERKRNRLLDRLELILCTNGVLIDSRLSKLFARYGVTVAIGINETPAHNHYIRTTKAGNLTFERIKYVIRQLIRDGVRVVASVIITPANVHQLGEYPTFLRKLSISQFGFNLLKGKALKRELGNSSLEEYVRAAAQGVLEGLININDDGSCYEYQLEKKLTILRNKLPFSIDCTGCGNQLVIHADGQVSNCPFLRIDQGHVQELPLSFRISQTEVVKMWRTRLPLFNDTILMDKSIGILDGGGCAWSSWELYGDITARDMVNAIFTKEVMDELIWSLLPREQAEALQRGDSYFWSYRRLRSL